MSIKKSIKAIMAGLLVFPMFALSVSLLTPAASVTAVENCDANGINITTGAECSHGTGTPSNLFGDGSVFQRITDVALGLIAAISVLMLIYGGIRYTTSGGNSNNVTAAKDTIMYAIIGIIIAVLAYAIVHFVLTSLLTS